MKFFNIYLLPLLAPFASCLMSSLPSFGNSTYTNPILPVYTGFHPDPSCIFVADLEETFFCASSSFNAIPGIPIHASKDLQNWKLIGNVLTRRDQLPTLQLTNGSTSGIWAPTIRYHDGTFYILTTLVFNNEPQTNLSRWDNVVFHTKTPFDDSTWSRATHFDFLGYDVSPFWDMGGAAYIVGSHAWQLYPAIDLRRIDLTTGKVGPEVNLWNGTGGVAPEGPHIYHKDGYYYLIIAEGGTGMDHMETIARSTTLEGPYTPYQRNPILTAANTTGVFQTLGHADLFQDTIGRWWGVALSTRAGPNYTVPFPMGRETVLFPVTWEAGAWPVCSQVEGVMSGWHLPPVNKNIKGGGAFINVPDKITFPPESKLPTHFVHNRFPTIGSYTISPPERPYSLRLTTSKLNLTAIDASTAITGQTFVGRRQVDSLFVFSVVLNFEPKEDNVEAGVSVFVLQDQHMDLGLIRLNGSMYLTWHAMTAILETPDPVTVPLPSAWKGKAIRLEIKAHNVTQYMFSAGPADSARGNELVASASGYLLSGGFTGAILGAYATSNGASVSEYAYFSNWTYNGRGQLIN